MSFVRGRGAARAALAIVMATFGVACSSETDALAENAERTPAEEASDQQVPSIYLDRVIQHSYVDGINKQREGYQFRVKTCREAGLPTRPLTAGETALLGTTRVQIWRGPGRAAMRRESWDSSHGEIADNAHCKFQLVVSGEHVYYDAEQTIWRDLATGEAGTEPADPLALDISPIQAADEAAMVSGRWPGVAGPTTRSVAGQPCKEWKTSKGSTICIWSGGAQWGFDYGYDGQFSDLNQIRMHRFVLDAQPGTDGSFATLTTRKFVIGGPLDVAAMMPERSPGNAGDTETDP